MIIKIQQPNTITENISNSILDYLYLKFKSNTSSNNVNSLLEGRVEVDYEYEKYINYLEALYNRFKVNVNREMLVWFDDENVKQVLINKLSLGNIGGVPVSKKNRFNIC